MDRTRRSHKHSDHELKRLVEQAVADSCDLPRRGLSFQVDAVEVNGFPPEVITVWATLHFLPSGSPFCCGEPGCHLGLHADRLDLVSDHVRNAMRLRQQVTVDLGDRIGVRYHEGVKFHYGAI